MQTLIASSTTTTPLKPSGLSLPGQSNGLLMTSEILNVVIDERKTLGNIDTTALMRMRKPRFTGQQNKVFKNYILSSEVFYVDGHYN